MVLPKKNLSGKAMIKEQIPSMNSKFKFQQSKTTYGLSLFIPLPGKLFDTNSKGISTSKVLKWKAGRRRTQILTSMAKF